VSYQDLLAGDLVESLLHDCHISRQGIEAERRRNGHEAVVVEPADHS
jgi:hypothetical protein